MQLDEMLNKLDAVIGQVWETDVTEAQLTKITECEEFRVLPETQVTTLEFQGGRLTVWLDDESRIFQITYEMSGGGLLIVP